MNISLVGEDRIDDVWPELLPFVVRGLEHGQGDSVAPDDILRDIKSGDMLLWVAHEGGQLYGGLVLQVLQGDRNKVVFVVLIVGVEHEKWADEMESLLIAYKKGIGADCIEASCRKGVAKSLLRRGWRQKAIIMEAPNGE